VYGAYPYSEIGIGNDDLKPEESVNTEVGVYWQQDALALDATVFYTSSKTKSRLLFVPPRTPTSASTTGISLTAFPNTLTSAAEIYGLELNGDWQVTDALKANANYT
jgi:iron complex outermembrane receptor protein/outer membrane receptor for ferrienterochelin and colicins